jgi:N6-adenosine-specific RNA methylase IME4
MAGQKEMMMDGPYQVIYADPPWKYDFIPRKKDRVENHYPTMSLEDICNLKFNIAKDAVLYLWTTAPKLLEGLQVMEAWGFKYKTHMVWDKGSPAYGFWFRGQHEVLLVGTRGHFSPPGKYERIPSVLKAKRTCHSEKPKEIRDLIKSWFPDARRLEVFARDVAEGWDCWGNGVRECLWEEGKRNFGVFPVAWPLAHRSSPEMGPTPNVFCNCRRAAKPGCNTAETGCPPTSGEARAA